MTPPPTDAALLAALQALYAAPVPAEVLAAAKAAFAHQTRAPGQPKPRPSGRRLSSADPTAISTTGRKSTP